MKYLYKGMGIPGWGDISGSVLLGWHEKVRRENIHFVDHDSGSWRDMGKKMLTTTSLIPPLFFFLAVNRGCRSGMYCSYNDRSKNRVRRTVPVQSSENNFSQHFLIMIILRESSSFNHIKNNLYLPIIHCIRPIENKLAVA